MKRAYRGRDYESAVPMLRGLILYVCVIVIFGCIIALVQASMAEKRIRYHLAERFFENMRLMEDSRRLDNQIHSLESYERIAELVRERLPELQPPRYPAVELEVPGLSARTGAPDSVIVPEENPGWLTRFRRQWRGMEEKVRHWARALVE